MADAFVAQILTTIQSVAPNATTRNATGGSAQRVPLPVGSTVTGTVVSRDETGAPILRTQSGDLVLKSDLYLRIGQEVTLRIDAGGDQIRARIVLVDGLPPKPDTPTLTDDAFTPATLSGARGAVSLPSLSQTTAANTNLTATLLATTAPATAAFSGNAAPQLQAAVLPAANAEANAAPTLPSPAALASAPTIGVTVLPPATSSAAALVASLATASPSPAGQTPQLITGANFQAALVSIAFPEDNPAPAVPTAPLLPAALTRFFQSRESAAITQTPLSYTPSTAPNLPTVITARVIGIEKSGAAIVQTPVGTLQLPPNLGAPVGSVLTLAVTPDALPLRSPANNAVPNASSTNAQPRSVPELLSNLSRGWASLTALTRDALPDPDLTLAASGAAAATATGVASAILQRVPQVGSGFVTSTLFFLAALNGGDLEQWLGKETVQTLRNRKDPQPLARLSADFATARQLMTETQNAPWQALWMPAAFDQEIQMLKLYVRRDKEENTKNPRKKPETRFVVEIEMSELGPLQLDGLVRRQDEKTSVDLIVRSRYGLPPDIGQELLAAYHALCESMGFTGGLHFHQMDAFPVHPMEEILAAAAPPSLLA